MLTPCPPLPTPTARFESRGYLAIRGTWGGKWYIGILRHGTTTLYMCARVHACNVLLILCTMVTVCVCVCVCIV